MRFLLDTNVLIWLVAGSRNLGPRARQTISGAGSLFVSEVSLLEISVKVSINKLPSIGLFAATMGQLGIHRTHIDDRYLARLEILPLLHRDPFDRMLVAQALSDDLTVLTADPVFAKYGVRVADARE
jgi:PIN domain nuclease of toxin-antitoxin system